MKTRFGNFFIRDNPFDLAVASPSFERLDLIRLKSIIQKHLELGNRVFFVDIGAEIGKYSVSIAKYFNKYQSQLKIYGFEPNPETYQLLNKNIKINELNNIKTYNLALSSSKGSKRFFYYAPAGMFVSYKTDKKIFVKTTKLDYLFTKLRVRKGDRLIIKIDVEGHETDVLKGAKKIIRSFNGATLLIEDTFKNEELNCYLSRNATLLFKLSPLNSFWDIYD